MNNTTPDTNVKVTTGLNHTVYTSAEALNAAALAAQREVATTGLNRRLQTVKEELDGSETMHFIPVASVDVPFQDLPQTPADYINALVESLQLTLNGDDWRSVVMDKGITAEFRPARTEPTPIVIHQLADRSVYFDPSKPFIGSSTGIDGDYKSGLLAAGTVIQVAPTKALHFSVDSLIYDHTIMYSGFTHGSLKTAVVNVVRDVDNAIYKKAAGIFETATGTTHVQLSPLTGSASAKGDEILDAIADNLSTSGYADKMDEVGLLMSSVAYRSIERVAQKAGYTNTDFMGSVEQMLGAPVMTFEDSAAKVFIMPRSLVGFSFRSALDGSGDVFKILVSRDASRQAYALEIVGCIDVLADSWTKLKTADGSTVDAQIKSVILLTFDKVAGSGS